MQSDGLQFAYPAFSWDCDELRGEGMCIYIYLTTTCFNTVTSGRFLLKGVVFWVGGV